MLGGSWTRRKQNANERGKNGGGGSFSTSRPAFLPKTTSILLPNCDCVPECLASSSTWNTLGRQPETTPSWQLLWRQKEQLHRPGCHRIYPEDQQGSLCGSLQDPASWIGASGDAPGTVTAASAGHLQTETPDHQGFHWSTHTQPSKTTSHPTPNPPTQTSWGAVATLGLTSALTTDTQIHD